MAKDIEIFLDNVLTWITLATKKSSRASTPLNFFSGAVPFVDGCASLEHATRDTEFLIPTCVTPGDLDKPLDLSMIGNLESDDSSRLLTKNGEGGCVLYRSRIVPFKSVRGQIPERFAADRIYEVRLAIIDTKGDYTKSGQNYFIWRKGSGTDDVDVSRWIRVGPTHYGREIGVPAESFERNVLQIACGTQFSNQLYWQVEMGYVGHPTISFTTDSLGAREVFRLRDIPEGKSRREALLHWVSEHWKQSRKGEDYQVRTHMRGAEKFVWNGLRCVITPSPGDIAKAKQEERFNAEGQDRNLEQRT